MTRKEYFDIINELIASEYGKPLRTEEDKLINAELDSFGYTILFVTLDNEYNYFYDIKDKQNIFETINFKEITIKEIIDKLIETEKIGK